MSDAPGTPQGERNEQRSNRFQREFDRTLFGLLTAGLLIALIYGGAAGTCPPDPQRESAMASNQTATAQTSRTQPVAKAARGVATKAAVTTKRTATVSAPISAECGQSSRLVGVLLALLIALAALAMGAFVGFLFGLPRSLTSSDYRAAAQAKVVAREKVEEAEKDTPEGAAAPANPAGAQASEVNTNLEKISDWLTTIIVGVGLTKLQEIPGGIEAFGDRVAPYFGYGGKVFGIAGGLFFLIGGFFLAYVGTRVKLSLIFLWSQIRNWDATERRREIVEASLGADVVQTDLSPPISDDVKRADEVLLSKSLSDLKTPDEVLAWANAKARAQDFTAAVAAYRDVINKVPLTEKLQTDFAQLLAAIGDTAAANNVVANLATTGITPQAENEARQKVAAAAQVGRAAALRTRLQQGLYKDSSQRGFDDSIAAGEELLQLPDASQDAWIHVWLAAAYGQKHAAEKAAAAVPPTADEQGELDALRSKVIEQAKEAVKIDPRTKAILRGLYDPSTRIGDDDDLDSLRPDKDLEAIFADAPPVNT